MLSGYNWARKSGRVGLARSIYNRNAAGRNQFASRLGSLVSSRLLARQRRGRSFTIGRNRRGTTSGIGVTTQHDARTVYVKRRMPRSRRRRWRSFVNRVNAVSEKDLGTQQVVFNRIIQPQNTNPLQQCLQDLSLYSLKSGSFSYHNDLNQIAQYLSTAADTPSTGLQIEPSTKILFQSAVLDITIRNTCLNNGVLDTSIRMEVDVYECYCNHPAEETGATYTNFIGLFQTNIANTKTLGGGAVSKIDIFNRGCTPFDTSYSLSRFGIKILKKTKYQISGGDQITYQMRDPRRYSIPFREMQNQDGCILPRRTKFILIVARAAPGTVVGPVGTPNVIQETLSIGCTRKYTFKVENYSEDRVAYDTL